MFFVIPVNLRNHWQMIVLNLLTVLYSLIQINISVLVSLISGMNPKWIPWKFA
ncbi:hypothetical protein T4A_6622 [Trichinella pseudospiralis]|uniref:Uncharacterized protein n=1 Tax=Trichinella pseudospiralis TaxID=6337 RepID=A0A0V1DL88_TRIPS|nr:hypothetical protein T4A_6622 [Trichinella pseudospiralis]